MAKRPNRSRKIVWLVRPALGLVVLAVLYLVGANVALNTGILRPVLAKRPEKLLVEWDSGWTVVPGIVHIEGFRVRGQTKKMQWQCRIEEGTFRISLFRLFGKTVRVSRGRGTGFEFYSRGRLDPDEVVADTPRHTPEIEGLSNPPDPAPESIYPPRKDPPKKPWTIDVSNVLFDGPADLWFQRLRMRGKGRVGGGFHFKIRTAMEINEAVVDLGAAEVTADGHVLADELDLDLRASIEPFLPRETLGLDIMGLFGGSIVLEDGRIPDLAVLGGFFPSGAGVRLVAGDGTMNVAMDVPSPRKAHGTFDVVVNSARLVATTGEEIEGDLALHARLDNGDLAAGSFDLGETTLTLDNMMLPDPKRERSEERTAEMAARREAKEEARAARSEEDAARVEKKRKKREQEAAEKEQREAAGEESLEVADDGDWWMHVRMKGGFIQLGRPMLVDTTFEFEMKDTKPLFRVFLSKPSEDGKTKMPAWAKLAPNIRNLEGDASLDLGPDGLIIDDVLIFADKMDMMARLKAHEHKLIGQMYVRYTIFHLGIDMGEDKKKMHWSKPKEWFIEQPELDDSTTLRRPPERDD